MKQSVRRQVQQSVRVYIVTESHCSMFGIGSLNIHTVPLQQQAAFVKQYEGRILVEANCIGEVLLKFSQWLHA